jgi:hypothetical protein
MNWHFVNPITVSVLFKSPGSPIATPRSRSTKLQVEGWSGTPVYHFDRFRNWQLTFRDRKVTFVRSDRTEPGLLEEPVTAPDETGSTVQQELGLLVEQEEACECSNPMTLFVAQACLSPDGLQFSRQDVDLA